MGKIKETRELYKEVIDELSKSEENWLKFLDSSSWNFKYDFDDQILIYAQRPDAKACATMEEWNKKLKRWVKVGTKPIYIFDKNPYSEYPFKLVFDLSDTQNYNNTDYKLWTLKKEYEQDIIENLEVSFGDIDSKENLSKAIISASYNMVLDNIEDYLTSVVNNKASSMFDTISDEEIKKMFITTAWASVAYMIMTRCGIDAQKLVGISDFSNVKFFNTQELITILGTSVSDISEMGLREIAKTVAILQKKENLKNRTFEENNKELYHKESKKIEGGFEYGKNRIYETGRLLYAQSINEERENTSREIRSNEIQLSNEPPKTRIDNSNNERETNRTSNGNPGASKQARTRISGTNGDEKWNNRRIESQGSNDMGGVYEQLQDDSTRDSSERTDLHLEKNSSQRSILTKEEQAKELQETRENVKNQAEQQEYALASRVYSFVKPSELYNYTDDTASLNTDEENIEIVKADISDTRNVNDYVNALNKIRESITDTDSQKHELDVLISILEKRVPHYEYNLGDTVFIGADKYEIAGIKNNVVTLIDTKFPILNKTMNFDEFERKVKDNYYSNDHLKVKEQENVNISNKVKNLDNITQVEQKDLILTYNNKKITKETQELIELLEYIFKKYEFTDYEITIKDNGKLERIDLKNGNYIHVNGTLKYLINILEERDEEFVGNDINLLSKALNKLRDEEKQYILGKQVKLDDGIYTVTNMIYDDLDFDDYVELKNNVDGTITSDISDFIKYLLEQQELDNINKKELKDNENIEKNQSSIDDSLNVNQKEKVKQEEKIEEKPYKVGQKVYLESDRSYNICSIDLEKDKIELQDLQMPIPIFRVENILTFENLYNQNERNFPKQDIKPNFVRTKNKIQDFVLHPEISLEDRNNYRITDNNLGVGTPKEKFERNIAAIKVLKKCEQENRYATPEEQEILSKYVGWGGLQQAFKEDDASWSKEYNILKNVLNDEEYKVARGSVLTAFYTPPVVINAMYEILQNMGLKEANILEPSCGVGNFLGMLPEELKNCKMYGIEIDSISGRIAQQLYQKSTIAINPYEKIELPDSFFDIAVRKCTF